MTKKHSEKSKAQDKQKKEREFIVKIVSLPCDDLAERLVKIYRMALAMSTEDEKHVE